MDITIENLQESEIKSFCTVFKQVLEESFPGYAAEVKKYFTESIYTPAMYQFWIKQKSKYVVVAKYNTAIIGFAVIDSPYGGVSLCRWLGILKQYQNKGIGKKLIKAWGDIAKSDSCHKMEVAAQPQAKGFYEKMGLVQEGFRSNSYFGIDQYLYGKIIGSPDTKVMTNF